MLSHGRCRLLLECGGPLPQYHPTFLAALLLSSKHAMAAAILQRLAAWLAALQQHTQAAAGAEGEAEPLSPLSPGTHVNGAWAAASGARNGAGSSRQLPTPVFSGGLCEGWSPSGRQIEEVCQQQICLAHHPDCHKPACAWAGRLLAVYAGLSLSELVDPQVMQLPPPQQQHRKPAAAAVAPPAPLAVPMQQQPTASSHDSGMLDLAAFGMAASPPPAAEAIPAASSHDSGMLDLAAFGMAPAAPAAVLAEPAASSLDSGMLDLAAFGMAPAAPAAVLAEPAASSLDSGMLDLAAFGMAAAAPAAVLAEPVASSLDSGMLDLAAFGMAPPSAAAAPAALAQTAPALVPTQTPPQAASQQRRVQLPPPPCQALLPADQLLPVAAQCCQQLRELLLPPSSSPGVGGDAAGISSGFGSTGSTAEQPASGEELPTTAIPGLSLAETSAVLSIAEAFSAGPAAAGANGSGTGGAPVDAAAAHFIGALSLACASSSREQEASSSGGSAQQAPQAPARVTVKNAAGVEYTLAPSAVAGTDGAAGSNSSSSTSVGQQWGLLPGLDATAVLWALLSGACAAAAGSPACCMFLDMFML